MKLHMSLLFVIFTLFIGCSAESEHPEETIVTPVKEEQPKKLKKVKVDTSITNKNVVEKLTAYGEKHKETIVDIYTGKGKIRIKLFKDTPLHRANFIMLTKRGYFDGTYFTRAVKDFMAQCGSPATYVHTDFQRALGKYSIPAEINKKYYHKQGVVGAAREYQNNPKKRSSPFNFYFVEGTRFSDETLDKYEELNSYTYSKEQRKYYSTQPGAAHIDGLHTIFGKILSGQQVVHNITLVETDRQDWPVDDIFIDSAKVVY